MRPLLQKRGRKENNMENENTCVFCGERLFKFSSSGIGFAETYQPCCKSCLKELKNVSEEEKISRALRLGFANQPEKLEERLELITTAEEHRPACLRCGAKMLFEDVQCFDNTPFRDGLLASGGYALLPSYCEECGRYEFYRPETARGNKFIAYLTEKDTSR